MRNLSLTFLLVALAGCAASPPPPPLPTVASVDLTRYAGRWYEIALLPNSFQRQCVSDTQANYRPDGERVEVRNRCRRADGSVEEATGHAEPVPGSGNAKLRVTFFWPFYGDYQVLSLDAGYQAVLVGEPSRRYAWVLSRTPQLEEPRLQALLDEAARLGFDRHAFQRTPQRRAAD
jgi:apolipoprotein D and lipocalin family protein